MSLCREVDSTDVEVGMVDVGVASPTFMLARILKKNFFFKTLALDFKNLHDGF